jgi:nitroreductase
MAEALDLAPALLLWWPISPLWRRSIATSTATRSPGGASIYPFAWNLLLAARAEGLGGVITTMAIRREEEMRQLFSIPETSAVAAVVVLGRPVSAARRLRRPTGRGVHLGGPLQGAAFDGSD